MTAYCSHDSELDYRSYDLRVDSLTSGTLRGVAIPYERWQRVNDDASLRARRPKRIGRIRPPGATRFREKVRDGGFRLPKPEDTFGDAFAEALHEQGIHDVQALVNHDRSNVLGSMSKKSLRLKNVDKSLQFELDLPNTPAGNKVLDKLNAKDDRRLGMSVGFKRFGSRSNIVRKNFEQNLSDELVEQGLDVPDELRATEEVTGESTKTPDLQTGLLDGSDYVEAVHVPTGRNWRVFFQIDMREISVLVDRDPAWEGTFAELGKGAPQNLAGARERQIIMAGLGVV